MIRATVFAMAFTVVASTFALAAAPAGNSATPAAQAQIEAKIAKLEQRLAELEARLQRDRKSASSRTGGETRSPYRNDPGAYNLAISTTSINASSTGGTTQTIPSSNRLRLHRERMVVLQDLATYRAQLQQIQTSGG